MKRAPRGEGWGLPADATRYHYFAGARSLCGKWPMTSRPLLGREPVDTSRDCKPCTAKAQDRYVGE